VGWESHRAHYGNHQPPVIVYLTFNDPPSGIYSSQVIDVVKFITAELKVNIRLVALISLREFFKNRKKIKDEFPGAIVLPMFPGVSNWKMNQFTLKLIWTFLAPEKIIGRSVLATQLALISRKRNNKVIYDGRGAIAAEWAEYGVVENERLLSDITGLVKNCLEQTIYRIAVSNALVQYWNTVYGYSSQDHTVIPCTLATKYENLALTAESIQKEREVLGFSPDDVVYAYAGSLAGWQGFNLMFDFISLKLQSDHSSKFVLLADSQPQILNLQRLFPGRIICRLVSQDEVIRYLLASDYGILIREASITNTVASPVKFAEYLSCGLKVIISPGIGDYSSFVQTHDAGYLYPFTATISRPTINEKIRMNGLALSSFTKKIYRNNYHSIIMS
jgi:hypothetical protein